MLRAHLALGRSPSTLWVEWAVAELLAGRDSPNLRVLAGLSEPFDHHETVLITERALAEVAKTGAQTDAVRTYVVVLLEWILEGRADRSAALSELALMCIESGYPETLMPFYLLHFAQLDLAAHGDQHYWDGANPSNIEAIIDQEAINCLARERAA